MPSDYSFAKFLVGCVAVSIALLFGAALVTSLNSIPDDFAESLNLHTVELVGAQGMGSGVVIKDGVVLTAAHVTELKDSMGEMVVKFRDASGGSVNRKGKVLWQSVQEFGGADVALVQVDTTGKVPAELSCAEVKAGDVVYSYGAPYGVPRVLTKGIVASNDDGIIDAFGADPFQLKMLPAGLKLLNLTVLPGNSGGGIYDTKGRLVGISELMLSHSFVAMTAGPQLCKMLSR